MTLNEVHSKLIDMSRRNVSTANKCRIELALAALDFVKHMVNPNSSLTASCEAEVIIQLILWSKNLVEAGCFDDDDSKAIDDAIRFASVKKSK